MLLAKLSQASLRQASSCKIGSTSLNQLNCIHVQWLEHAELPVIVYSGEVKRLVG